MHRQAHPFRIFLAEDSPIIRVSLTEHIQELVTASVVAWEANELTSIQWLQAHSWEWDVAVLDLFLAQGNGLGIAVSLSHRPDSQKVIVLSNYATVDIRGRCAAMGVDAVFDKSNQLEEFTLYLQDYGRKYPC